MPATRNGITVRPVAGTHAVLLTFDAAPAARAGLMGFALGTRDPAAGPEGIRWMRGFKFFKALVPHPQPGERRALTDHPVQDFRWGDWGCSPGQTRDYVVRALYGEPGALRTGAEIDLRVTTRAADADHAVFHNRGAIPSQAFADRFGNVGPTPLEQEDPDNDKVKWLSRGLLEACLGFIAEARGPRHELRVCAYEFTYGPIARALREAAGRGATVRLIYDAGKLRQRDGVIVDNDTSPKNRALIAATGLDRHPGVSLHPRRRYPAITHNKFILLLDNGHPAAVWTGSTNFTASGFLGQSNLAHLIRDPVLAQAFNGAWEALAADPDTRAAKRAMAALSPDPAGALPQDRPVAVFSPRAKGMLDWYRDAAAAGAEGLFLTAAFGVAPEIAAGFTASAGTHPRLVLSERKGRNAAVEAALAARREVQVAIGEKLNARAISLGLPGEGLDRWFRAEDHFRRKGNIYYIHTKLMLVDPLGADPQVFTGSANFSRSSVESNDENMVLMRGPAFAGVAQVEVCEFMRLFNHLYFRTVAVRTALAGRGQPERAAILDPDDRWVRRHFTPGTHADRMRRMFGGA